MEVVNESLFEEKDIVNREFYDGIKNMINCAICHRIVSEPVQCNKCQHCFCLQCSLAVKGCPYQCQFQKFVPSLLCNQLLKKLIVRCECGNATCYEFLDRHIEICDKANYRKKYIQIKKKYELLSKELNDDSKFSNDYMIKSSLHHHPIECIRNFLQTWKCDNCHNTYYDDVPSYHCTLCDYDLCFTCAINTIMKGTIKREMIKYYENKHKDLTQYSTISSLHHHPIELLKSYETEWCCNNCLKKFTNDTASFRCTLCDFDLCFNCAEKTSVSPNPNIRRLVGIH